MSKIGKIAMSAAALTMVVSGFFGLLAPVARAQGDGLINADSLGVSYGAATGLGSEDVRATVARIIRVAMGLLGIVAVVIILVGGFKWMTAGGNDDNVSEAKKWIFAGVIGLAIILSAYALATFIINQLVSATTGTGTSI